MKRLPIIAAALLFPVLFAAAANDAPDHALKSAEDHDILAPRSSKDFTYSRFLEAKPEKPANSAGNASSGSAGIANTQDYPRPLYTLDKTAGGWTLSVKQYPGLVCAVLLSPSVYTPEGWTAYALRSGDAIGNINDPRIRWGNTLVGPANNLHFLASSAYIADTELGDVLRIYIPERAIYGYWDTGAREYVCAEGTSVRLRLYTLPNAEHGARHFTYIVPLTTDIARAY